MQNPNQINGALPKDANNQTIQIAASFRTTATDADGNPILSPLVLTGGIQSIKMPQGGMELHLYPESNDLFYSEDPVMASKDKIIAGAKEMVAGIEGDIVYVEGTVDTNLYFCICKGSTK